MKPLDIYARDTEPERDEETRLVARLVRQEQNPLKLFALVTEADILLADLPLLPTREVCSLESEQAGPVLNNRTTLFRDQRAEIILDRVHIVEVGRKSQDECCLPENLPTRRGCRGR